MDTGASFGGSGRRRSNGRQGLLWALLAAVWAHASSAETSPPGGEEARHSRLVRPGVKSAPSGTRRDRPGVKSAPSGTRRDRPGPEGRLVYTPDEDGNAIPDFSDCGYMGGGVRIPDVPVEAVVGPGEGDDGGRIQAALDRVAALRPGRGGFRGAVLLKAGRYELAGAIRISAGGVVLRGEGQGPDGTVVVAAGRKKRALVVVSGEGGAKEVPGTRRRIADDYVPVGARSFELESAEGLRAGDHVVVHRPGTKEWIHAIGMDRIPEKKGTKQWTPGGYHFRFERVVAKVELRRLTLDAPVVQAMEKKYGGGSVYKHEFPGRISQVGLEDLRLVSEYRKGQEKSDEEHAWDAVKLDRVENAWVRRVTAVHFGYSCVSVGRGAKHITVEDCACLDPVSKITGSRRYSFPLSGQLTLVQRCYARNGRHDFVMHSRVSGPNAFVDCLAEKCHSDIGPHHRWAAGTLFDNVRGRSINVQDRGNSGTGHGWAGAQQVFWNCRASSIICQRPPTAQNWCIGCIAKKSSRGRGREDGHWESLGTHVDPRSLYLKQLEDRLGPEAVRNVATPAQLDGTIHEEIRRRLSR